MTVAAARGLSRLAAEKGLTVEEEGGQISFVISAATPEDALAQLSLLSGVLAAKA